jgi:simple sugar transport system ATP-binding protein
VSVQTGSLGLPDETGFVPDDRLRDGLIPELSIIDNVALKGAGRRRGWFDTARVRSTAQRLVREYGIHATAVRALVSSLSGGNQQRLLVARELDGNPKLLVAMNPTRGLDIAAAADVHRRLLGARNAGMGIVYYTADLDELLAIADRILVVFDGHVREVPRDRASIGRAMLGAA